MKQNHLSDLCRESERSSLGTCGLKKRVLERLFVYIFSILILVSCQSKSSTVEISLPDCDPIVLIPYAIMHFPPISESSGIVKSRQWENVYWTHNDSGDKARIFPIRKDGTIIIPEWIADYEGVMIPDAVNIDWEDIATDNQGNLYIAACGNNSNMRRDLAVYLLKEPYPFAVGKTRILKKIPFYLPEQKSFPPTKLNFDVEALFWADDMLYLLTKHRDDDYTALYRFDSTDPNAENPLTLCGKFRIYGQVTAADASPDGDSLAVLTYNGVWVFDSTAHKSYFDCNVLWLPIEAKQCEGICFDGNVLIISNEQRELFELPIEQLIPLTIPQ